MTDYPAVRPGGRAVGRHVAAALAIAAVVAAAYLPPLFSGRVYYSEDTTDLNYVMLRSHVDDLKKHRFISWLPSIGTGHFRAADPTYSIYSPRLLIYWLIPDYDAQLATVIVYAMWAGLGAYVLGLCLTSSWFAALYMGLVWPLAGVIISRISNIPYFTSAAWLPWALAAWTGMGRPMRRALLTALAAAMVAVDGDLFGMAFTWAMLGMFSLAGARGKRARDLALCSLGGVLSAGLTAVIWAPALSVLHDSVRSAGLGYHWASSFSLAPVRLINLFAPRFFGDLMEGSFWGNPLTSSVQGHGFWFSSIYLGILTPLLAIASVWRPHPRHRAAAGLLAIGAVFALFAFGRNAPFLQAVRLLVPGATAFRYPAKLFTFSALCLMGAAGIGLSELPKLSGNPVARRRFSAAVIILCLAVLAIGLCIAVLDADMVRAVSRNVGLSFLRIEQDLGRIAAVAVILPALLYFTGRRSSKRALQLGLVALTVADLYSARPGFMLNMRADFFQRPFLAREIRERGPGRILVYPELFNHQRLGPRELLKPDWAVLEGLEYGIGISATMNDFITGLFDDQALRQNLAAVMRVLAARYILCSPDSKPEWIADAEKSGLLRPVRSWDKGSLVLDEAATPARAELTREVMPAANRHQALELALGHDDAGTAPVFIPGDTVIDHGRAAPGAGWVASAARLRDATGDAGNITAMERPDGDHLTINVRALTPAVLVVREYLMAGWHCRVDGKEAPVWFADGIGRAVMLEPGTHEVRFSFTPPLLAISAIVSSLLLFLTLAGLIWSVVRGNRSSAGPGT